MENKISLKNPHLTDENFLRMAYWVLFEREIDPAGLMGFSSELKKGLAKPELIKKLFESAEFQNRIIGSQGWGEIMNKLHNARVEMVKTLLPSAKNILDLGGCSAHDNRGALLSFGYPHLPEKISIVDLPPDTRMLEAAESSQRVNYKSCQIEYFYRSMADLTDFQEGFFDLIWSGESIEHITTEDAEKVFFQAYKLLKPGGILALDTPNRLATQLHSPSIYIHPEHKIEYYYQDLRQLLEKHNFKVVQTKGIIDLSYSINKNKMSTFYDQFIEADNFNDNPEKSYCFYFCCMRAEDL